MLFYRKVFSNRLLVREIKLQQNNQQKQRGNCTTIKTSNNCFSVKLEIYILKDGFVFKASKIYQELDNAEPFATHVRT